MTNQVYEIIKRIINLEKEEIPDYIQVEKLSVNAIKYVNDESLDINNSLYQFLEDFDVRRKDDKYRIFQTNQVEIILAEKKL